MAEFLQRNTMPASVLTSYLVPLVMAILRNDDDFSTQHVLRDFTIKALGSLCWCLPWESYCTMLLSCLRALLRGKQSTKLNVRCEQGSFGRCGCVYGVGVGCEFCVDIGSLNYACFWKYEGLCGGLVVSVLDCQSRG